MIIKDYIKDKIVEIALLLGFGILAGFLLIVFQVTPTLIYLLGILYVLVLLSLFTYEYLRRTFFYRTFLNALEQLDKKYLAFELMPKPKFYDGKILYQALYEASKSMNEYVRLYEKNTIDFKEYIELWVHEIKIPLSTCILMMHNHPELKKLAPEIRRIEEDIDQVLYYARSNATEKDYLIKKTSLEDVVNTVIRKHKENILLRNIQIEIQNVDVEVFSDAKWLEFMLGQILSNSIKYSKEKDAKICLSTINHKDDTTLMIEDNGIGIKPSDLPRIFDKSFTGENGRIGASSTGMGLYLCKKLASKLGLKIEAQSKEGEYTKIYIHFPKEEFYQGTRD